MTFSAVAKICSIGSQYIIIAILSRNLSAYEFGIWAILSHLMIVLSILDFGIGGGGFRNELTRLQVQNNAQGKELFFASFIVSGVLSLALLMLNLLLIKYSVCLFFKADDALLSIQPIFYIFLLFVFIKIPCSLYINGFYAYQEIAFKAILDCVEALGLVLMIATITWMKGSFVSLFLTYCIFVLLINGVGFTWFIKRRRWKWSTFSFGSIKQKVVPLLRVNFLFWLQNIVSILLFSLSPILINRLGGPLVTGEYILIYRLYCLFIGIHFALLNPLWSLYTDAFYKYRYLEIKQRCRQSLQVTLIVLICAAICVTLLYQPLIYIWTGKTINALFLVVLSGVWMVLYGVINCLSVLLNAVNRIGRQVFFLFIGAILNVFLGVALGKSWGMVGVVIAAIIALLPLLLSNMIEVVAFGRQALSLK